METNEIEGIDDDISSQLSTDDSDSDTDSPYNSYDNDYDEDSYNPQAQLSTAVSKLQIKLNNLINNLKASLKLHDDIVDLFNEYIASPNFDLYATLKSRKTFIRSMESSYGVTKLRPMNTEVILHDTSRVTVPVFIRLPREKSINIMKDGRGLCNAMRTCALTQCKTLRRGNVNCVFTEDDNKYCCIGAQPGRAQKGVQSVVTSLMQS